MKLKFDSSFLKHAPDNQYLMALLPRLKEKKVQTFTTLTLTLVTFSIFAVFAISPTLGTITDLQKQISDSQFVNDQLQKKITALSVLQDNYTRLKPQLPAVMTAVPTTAELATFLGQLQALGDASGVAIDRVQTLPIDLSTPDPLAKYTSFSFAIDVEGGYDSTILFLKKVTTFNRIISIDALSFGKTSRLSQNYTLSMRGRAYFQP